MGTFCVCLLNIFIAVHSSAYQQSDKGLHEVFYQKRAEACFEVMADTYILDAACLNFSQRERCCSRRYLIQSLVLYMMVVTSIWLLLLTQDWPVSATILLSFASWVVDLALLRQAARESYT